METKNSVNNTQNNNASDLKEYVLHLLENYRDMERQICLLRYEMEHSSISPEDVIGEMAFARGEGAGRSPSQVSNKTLYIALNYQEKMDSYNAEVTSEIAARLWKLEREQQRLAYFLELLEPRQREVLKLYYLEKNSWELVAEKMDLTARRAQSIRKMAVESLCEMYALVAELA